MSHFNVLFVFGYFPSLFLQCIRFWPVSFEPKCLAALRTRVYIVQLLYGESPYIILFPSQTLGCDWCRSAVTYRKCSFRSHGPGICLGWRTCGPWKKPVSCGKDKGLHTCTGETKESRPAGHGRATWCSLWPQQQGPEGLPTIWTVGLLDLGNKVMFTNSLLPWLGNEIHRFKGCMMLWNFHPSWESLKTWNVHMSPWDLWLISELKGLPVIWSL